MLKKLRQNVVLVTLIATGIATIWGFFAVWAIENFERRTRGEIAHETLAVDASGNAWVKVYLNSIGRLSDPQEFPYRTLDGKPITAPEHDYWISECRLTRPDNVLHARTSKNRGLEVINLTRTDRELWYLVHTNESKNTQQTAYLVGYDYPTRRPIGYVGISGFRAELPDESQWIPVYGNALGYMQGSYALTYSARNPRVSIASPAGWFEFDIKQREFIVIDDSQHFLSTSSCSIADELPEKLREKMKEADYSPRMTSAHLTESFAARVEDRILVQNTLQDTTQQFVIPKEYRDHSINFFYLSGDSALLETSIGHWTNAESEVVWINAAGEIEKKKTIKWNRYRGPSSRTASWFITLALPIPLAWGTIIFAMIPFTHNGPSEYPDWGDAGYLERVGLILMDFWPAMVVIVILSVGLTWVAMHWHRLYARPHAAAWASLVFLLGVPGFLTYWLCYRKPPVQACRSCGKPVPRNRSSCISCEQSFPEPALLGTEVLA